MPVGLKVRTSNVDKLIATYATSEAANGAQIELTKNYPGTEFIVEAVAPDAPVETSEFNIPFRLHFYIGNGKAPVEHTEHSKPHAHTVAHGVHTAKKK